MSASNLNVILAGAVAQVINNVYGNTQVNSSFQNPTLGATDAIYNSFVPIPTTPTVAVIVSPSFVLYVKNLGGQNGDPSGNITVTVTPVGGSPAEVCVLPPGGLFLYWNTTESAGGISGMSLTASANGTPVEILSAG